MLNTKGLLFPFDVIMVCIRWYAAYTLSYRHLDEMMGERGVEVDHSSINRWAIRFLPLLEKAFRKHKRPAGSSWRVSAAKVEPSAGYEAPSFEGICGGVWSSPIATLPKVRNWRQTCLSSRDKGDVATLDPIA